SVVSVNPTSPAELYTLSLHDALPIWSTSRTAERYRRMRDALVRQENTIQYSLCAWGHAHVEQWGNDTGHSWRMWGDIYPEWAGRDRKSTRLNSSHVKTSYAVFCLKKK